MKSQGQQLVSVRDFLNQEKLRLKTLVESEECSLTDYVDQLTQLQNEIADLKSVALTKSPAVEMNSTDQEDLLCNTATSQLSILSAEASSSQLSIITSNSPRAVNFNLKNEGADEEALGGGATKRTRAIPANDFTDVFTPRSTNFVFDDYTDSAVVTPNKHDGECNYGHVRDDQDEDVVDDDYDDDTNNGRNVLEFCVVEPDWDHLCASYSPPSVQAFASQSKKGNNITTLNNNNNNNAMMTPLLPPLQTWRYPVQHAATDNTSSSQAAHKQQYIMEKSARDGNFFFPSGVKVDLVSRAAITAQKRLSTDSRHIVQFNDERGVMTYACCLTVVQVYTLAEIDAIDPRILYLLTKLDVLKIAAKCIQKYFRAYVVRKKKRNWQRVVDVANGVAGSVSIDDNGAGGSSTQGSVQGTGSVSGGGNSSTSTKTGFFTRMFSRKGTMSEDGGTTTPGGDSNRTPRTGGASSGQSVSVDGGDKSAASNSNINRFSGNYGGNKSTFSSGVNTPESSHSYSSSAARLTSPTATASASTNSNSNVNNINNSNNTSNSSTSQKSSNSNRNSKGSSTVKTSGSATSLESIGENADNSSYNNGGGSGAITALQGTVSQVERKRSSILSMNIFGNASNNSSSSSSNNRNVLNSPVPSSAIRKGNTPTSSTTTTTTSTTTSSAVTTLASPSKGTKTVSEESTTSPGGMESTPLCSASTLAKRNSVKFSSLSAKERIVLQVLSNPLGADELNDILAKVLNLICEGNNTFEKLSEMNQKKADVTNTHHRQQQQRDIKNNNNNNSSRGGGSSGKHLTSGDVNAPAPPLVYPKVLQVSGVVPDQSFSSSSSPAAVAAAVVVAVTAPPLSPSNQEEEEEDAATAAPSSSSLISITDEVKRSIEADLNSSQFTSDDLNEMLAVLTTAIEHRVEISQGLSMKREAIAEAATAVNKATDKVANTLITSTASTDDCADVNDLTSPPYASDKEKKAALLALSALSLDTNSADEEDSTGTAEEELSVSAGAEERIKKYRRFLCQSAFVVTAQKAYCAISSVPEYTFVFKILDAIAEAELHRKSSMATSAASISGPTTVTTPTTTAVVTSSTALDTKHKEANKNSINSSINSSSSSSSSSSSRGRRVQSELQEEPVRAAELDPVVASGLKDLSSSAGDTTGDSPSPSSSSSSPTPHVAPHDVNSSSAAAAAAAAAALGVRREKFLNQIQQFMKRAFSDNTYALVDIPVSSSSSSSVHNSGTGNSSTTHGSSSGVHSGGEKTITPQKNAIWAKYANLDVLAASMGAQSRFNVPAENGGTASGGGGGGSGVGTESTGGSPAISRRPSGRNSLSIVDQIDWRDSSAHSNSLLLNASASANGGSGAKQMSSVAGVNNNNNNNNNNNKRRTARKKGFFPGNDPRLCTVSVPGYTDGTLIINTRSLLSTKEWTYAVLITHLNSQIITKIINLLLMEKSLIIYGHNPGVVTSITLAVVSLISPFIWEGLFVPLVPDNARELFEAPVPLIVGTTSPPRASDISASTAVLYLNDDIITPKYAPVATAAAKMSDFSPKGSSEDLANSKSLRIGSMSCDSRDTVDTAISGAATNGSRSANAALHDSSASELSLSGGGGTGTVNLDSVTKGREYEFVAWFVRLPEVSADMPVDAEMCRRIDYTRSLLCKHYIDKMNCTRASKGEGQNSSQHSPPPHAVHINNTFDAMLLSDVPAPILKQVRVLITSIKRHNVKFCGEDMTGPTSWKRYMKYSALTGREEFDADVFLEPMRSLLEFQEAIVKTQSFYSFIEKLRMDQHVLDNIRTFIGHWIYFRVVKRRKEQARRQQEKKGGKRKLSLSRRAQEQHQQHQQEQAQKQPQV